VGACGTPSGNTKKCSEKSGKKRKREERKCLWEGRRDYCRVIRLRCTPCTLIIILIRRMNGIGGGTSVFISRTSGASHGVEASYRTNPGSFRSGAFRLRLNVAVGIVTYPARRMDFSEFDARDRFTIANEPKGRGGGDRFLSEADNPEAALNFLSFAKQIVKRFELVRTHSAAGIMKADVNEPLWPLAPQHKPISGLLFRGTGINLATRIRKRHRS
jgi:hypothetical protein